MTGVQTCALPICGWPRSWSAGRCRGSRPASCSLGKPPWLPPKSMYFHFIFPVSTHFLTLHPHHVQLETGASRHGCLSESPTCMCAAVRPDHTGTQWRPQKVLEAWANMYIVLFFRQISIENLEIQGGASSVSPGGHPGVMPGGFPLIRFLFVFVFASS